MLSNNKYSNWADVLQRNMHNENLDFDVRYENLILYLRYVAKKRKKK